MLCEEEDQNDVEHLDGCISLSVSRSRTLLTDPTSARLSVGRVRLHRHDPQLIILEMKALEIAVATYKLLSLLLVFQSDLHSGTNRRLIMSLMLLIKFATN